MRFASRLTLLCALLPSVLASPVGARDAGAKSGEVPIEVGPHVVCDTQKQMERFVALFDGNVERTTTAVNSEEQNPTACSVGVVAYVMGPEIATARNQTGTYHIVRILVLGVATEAGMQASVPTPFFAVTRIEELDA